MVDYLSINTLEVIQRQWRQEQLYNMSGGGKGFEEKASKGVRLMVRVGIGMLCTLVWKSPDKGIFE